MTGIAARGQPAYREVKLVAVRSGQAHAAVKLALPDFGEGRTERLRRGPHPVRVSCARIGGFGSLGVRGAGVPRTGKPSPRSSRSRFPSVFIRVLGLS